MNMNKPKTASKSHLIREMARQMIADGIRPSPIVIARRLKAEKDVLVYSSQVSMALKGTGMEYRPSENKPDLLDPVIAIRKISIEDLVAAKEFVQKIGDAEKALAALAAFRGLRK